MTDTKQSIYFYLEMFYNSRRRHTVLDYLSPIRFEVRHLAASLPCPSAVEYLEMLYTENRYLE